MLTIKLQGGLGNQLFQLAFLDYVSAISGKRIYISDLKSPSTVHSSEQSSIYDCGTCGVQTEFEMKTIPYAMKLWTQELETMHIVPRLVFE